MLHDWLLFQELWLPVVDKLEHSGMHDHLNMQVNRLTGMHYYTTALLAPLAQQHCQITMQFAQLVILHLTCKQLHPPSPWITLQLLYHHN